MYYKKWCKAIDDAEDLDLVQVKFFFETTGSLWFYPKDEATNFRADIANTNNFKSFKYKAKLLGNAVAHPAPNQVNEI